MQEVLAMKKSHQFDELSDRVCDVDGCNHLIKERLIDGAPWTGKKEPHNAKKCFRCYHPLKTSGMTHAQVVGFKTTLKHIKALRFQFKMDRIEQDKKKVAKAEAKASA
jgi:hypothetical protein